MSGGELYDEIQQHLGEAREQAGREALAEALAPDIARVLYEASTLDRLAAYDVAPPKVMGRDGRMHVSPRPKFTSWGLLPAGIRTGWVDKVLGLAKAGSLQDVLLGVFERHPLLAPQLELPANPTSPDSRTKESH